MKKALFVLVAFLPSISLAAGTTLPICARYSDQIDSIQRLSARNHAEGLGDSSAARETNRLITENTLMLKESMLLQLMAQAKCTPPADVDYSARYISNASKCSIAMLKAQDNPGQFVMPAECDMAKWPDQRK